MATVYPLELPPGLIRSDNALKNEIFKFSLLIILVAPAIGTILAMKFLWGQAAGWKDVAILVGSYIPIALGVTAGYHRHFTHEAFKASKGLTLFLGIAAGMAIEGSLIQWVADHLWHHRYSDRELDLHSPHFGGLIHSHFGSFFKGIHADPKQFKRTRELLKDPLTAFINDYFLLWVVLSLLLPYMLGGWEGFLWGGLVRIFLVHHFTWSINSICHAFGTKNWRSTKGDQSRDVWWLLLALGEQWHRFHHAFRKSVRHAPHWILDPTYCFVLACKFTGQAWDLHLPTKQQMELKRMKPGEEEEEELVA